MLDCVTLGAMNACHLKTGGIFAQVDLIQDRVLTVPFWSQREGKGVDTFSCDLHMKEKN